MSIFFLSEFSLRAISQSLFTGFLLIISFTILLLLSVGHFLFCVFGTKFVHGQFQPKAVTGCLRMNCISMHACLYHVQNWSSPYLERKFCEVKKSRLQLPTLQHILQLITCIHLLRLIRKVFEMKFASAEILQKFCRARNPHQCASRCSSSFKTFQLFFPPPMLPWCSALSVFVYLCICNPP